MRRGALAPLATNISDSPRKPALYPSLFRFDAMSLADLYNLRFACRAVSAPAAVALVNRVNWLLNEALDADYFMSASADGDSDGPVVLAPFSLGCLLRAAKVPVNSMQGYRLFELVDNWKDRAEVLRGWRPKPVDLARLLDHLGNNIERDLQNGDMESEEDESDDDSVDFPADVWEIMKRSRFFRQKRPRLRCCRHGSLAL